MNQFYVSIIFIGILLIIVSLICIIYDKKRSYENSKDIDNKKEELVKIINDAEQMVIELNKFSDYIVTQIDEKNKELTSNLNRAQEKSVAKNYEISQPLKENKEKIDIYVKPEMEMDMYISTIQKEDILDIKKEVNANKYTTQIKIRDKNTSCNNRHQEVISLYSEGLSETEIARRLNMGKGEIQLILGLNK